MTATHFNDHPCIAFLKALYKHCEEGFINLRFLPSGENLFVLLSKIDSILPILEVRKGQNAFFGVATRVEGDGTKEGILRIPGLWIDIDLNKLPEEKKREIHQLLKDFPLKPSFVIDSGAGIHVYWILRESTIKKEIVRVEAILKRLAAYFHGDMNATDASRILRIPGTLNHKYAPPRTVTVKQSHPGHEHNLSEFEDLLPEEKPVSSARTAPQEQSERLKRIMAGCKFVQHCDRDRVTLPEPEWYAMVSVLARETAGINLIHDLSQGYPGYSRDETDNKILHALNRAGPATCERIKRLWDCEKDCGVSSPAVLGLGHKSSNSCTPLPPQSSPSWPAPLAKEAFHGLAGEYVMLVEPHTEADPVALLAQTLAAVGNVIGSTAYFQVEGDRHYLKLFPTLVGETSKGRKGTSTGHIKSIFLQIDPEWGGNRVMSGLSSGEGLIWQVRDEIKKSEPIKEKGRVTGDYQEIIIDAGEKDKRLLVVEPEFASTLRVMSRDGNTLSPTIRQAWDDGNLQTLTKNSPVKATGAHISIIGHITRDELRRYLDRTETGNGFANRFIWLCVKRSKVLPEGGQLHGIALDPIITRLRDSIEFGKTLGEMKKDRDAVNLWAEIYPELSEGKPGLLGAVISRGEAQVMRIACIYALLDKSSLVRREHLLAALAIWDYSEASARYIFGDTTGDPIADRILNAIRNSSQGLTRTEIRDLFFRNMNGAKIDVALSFLESHKLIHKVKEDTNGRPVERWIVVSTT